MLHRMLFIVSWIVLSMGLSGCGSDDTPSSPPPPPQHTLVFLDGSASAETHPEVHQVFTDSLARIVRMHLATPGDRLYAFWLHEKTRSKAYRLDLRNDVRPLQEKDFPDEQALERARYRKDIAEYLERATTDLQTFAAERDLPEAYARWTDIWGTLEVASETFPSRPGERHVYYLSDMYESMPGADRRNFDQTPPQRRSQAETWAQADVRRIRSQLTLAPDVLRTLRIRVLQGTLATKPNAQDVQVYWETLFETLGIPRENVRYN